jgi:hypothetical protein
MCKSLNSRAKMRVITEQVNSYIFSVQIKEWINQ